MAKAFGPKSHLIVVDAGSHVKFPLPPYECQVKLVGGLWRALRDGRDCVIESPTGTGKTLCLLAASISWALPRRKRVVYVSRTHSQLRQASRELQSKLVQLVPKLRWASLASREQLCTHPRVSKLRGSQQNRACAELCAERKCPRRFKFVEDRNYRDIEDLATAAHDSGACGYYSSRDLAAKASIVFAPYQYVLDPAARVALDLRADAFIFDEAHNVPYQAEEALSRDNVRVATPLANGIHGGRIALDSIINNEDEHLSTLMSLVKTNPESFRLVTIRGRTSCICTKPSLALAPLRPASLVFASGTLAPLDGFASDMQLTRPVFVENDHVVPRRNVFGAIVASVHGRSLVSTYKSRDSPEYVADLVRLLRDVLNNVPPQAGVLVFFPSYAALRAVQHSLSDIALFEPPSSEELPRVLQAFFANKKRALLAVCRGKISEGVDFPDDKCRCVVVAGIPYAPLTQDLKLVAKRESRQYGHDWYERDAMRAVNQALGRALRHKDDFAAIILADSRFARKTPAVSKWLRDNLNYLDAADLPARLASFFRASLAATFGGVETAECQQRIRRRTASKSDTNRPSPFTATVSSSTAPLYSVGHPPQQQAACMEEDAASIKKLADLSATFGNANAKSARSPRSLADVMLAQSSGSLYNARSVRSQRAHSMSRLVLAPKLDCAGAAIRKRSATPVTFASQRQRTKKASYKVDLWPTLSSNQISETRQESRAATEEAIVHLPQSPPIASNAKAIPAKAGSKRARFILNYTT